MANVKKYKNYGLRKEWEVKDSYVGHNTINKRKFLSTPQDILRELGCPCAANCNLKFADHK